MNFDPDVYTITIRKETVDGDVYYVGRVAEFMNVTAYEDSYEDALAIVRNSLCEIAAQAAEAGRQLPLPMAESCSEPSGRLTLRMPRALHARLNAQSLTDDVSANQLVNLAISEYLTGSAIVEMATSKITSVIDESMVQLRGLHGSFNSAILSASKTFKQQNTYSQSNLWHTDHGAHRAASAKPRVMQ